MAEGEENIHHHSASAGIIHHHHVNVLRDFDLERLFHALVNNPCRQQWSPPSLISHSSSILRKVDAVDQEVGAIKSEALGRLSFLKTLPMDEQRDSFTWCVGLDEWPVQPVTLVTHAQSQPPPPSSASIVQQHPSPKKARKR